MTSRQLRGKGDKTSVAGAVLVREIQEIVRSAGAKAFHAVNFVMVEAYWFIGKRIVEEEQKGRAREPYGRQLIRDVSRQLASEFGRGFSEANVWNFRQFYLTYPSEHILYTLRRELSWSHYRLIMRVENPNAREYYAREAAGQHWSARQLERNINSLYYERLLASRRTPPGAGKNAIAQPPTPSDHFKDPYVLEFLGLPMPAKFTEAEFEEAIIGNLQRFLLELGKGFPTEDELRQELERERALLLETIEPSRKKPERGSSAERNLKGRRHHERFARHARSLSNCAGWFPFQEQVSLSGCNSPD